MWLAIEMVDRGEKYVILIPFFKGDETIQKLIAGIRKHGTWPVIIVNDTGGLNKTLYEASVTFPQVQIIDLSRNHGQHYATFIGLQAISEHHVITMDEDMQHRPEDIISMVKKHEESGSDVVYARRQGEPMNQLIQSLLIHLFFPGGPETTSSFRLIDQKLIKSLVSKTPKFYQIEGLIMSFQPEYAYVDIQLQESQRTSIGSGYTILSKFNMVSNLIAFYSPRPWVAVNVLLLISGALLFLLLDRPWSYSSALVLPLPVLVLYSYIFARIKSAPRQ